MASSKKKKMEKRKTLYFLVEGFQEMCEIAHGKC